MMDSSLIQKKLKDLSNRECEILYWVCQGKNYEWIAKQMSWSVPLIQLEMSEIYDRFELGQFSREERRALLFETVCPIHKTQVRNPEMGCTDGVIEIGDPKPSPESLALVLKDERAGIIPVPGPEWKPPPPPGPSPQPPQPPRRPSSETSQANRYLNAPSPAQPSREIRWIILSSILGTLLFVAIVGLVILLVFNPFGNGNKNSTEPTSIAQATGVVARPSRVPPPTEVAALPASTSSFVQVVTATSESTSTFVQMVTATSAPTLVPTTAPTAIIPSPEPTINTAQDPPPGSNLPVGQGYSRSGVTVTLRDPISITDDRIGFRFLIENRNPQQLVVLWKNSFIHVSDDKNTVYRQGSQSEAFWDMNKQLTIDGAGQREIYAYHYPDESDKFDSFVARLDPSTKYLIITVDQLVGMKNMTWKYDLQQ